MVGNLPPKKRKSQRDLMRERLKNEFGRETNRPVSGQLGEALGPADPLTIEELRAQQREYNKWVEEREGNPPLMYPGDPALYDEKGNYGYNYTAYMPHGRRSSLHPDMDIDTDWRLNVMFNGKSGWNQRARWAGEHRLVYNAFWHILRTEYGVDKRSGFDWRGWREQYGPDTVR